MKTRTKIILWSAAVCLVAFLVWAANPSFSDFDTSQFITSSSGPNQVSILAGAAVTNLFLRNTAVGIPLTVQQTAGAANELIRVNDSFPHTIFQIFANGQVTLPFNSTLVLSSSAYTANTVLALNGANTAISIPNGFGVLTNDGSGNYGFSSAPIMVRAIGVADGTSISANSATMDICIQTNTQVAGTLTINNPSGTPVQGQRLVLWIKSNNQQTFAWPSLITASVSINLPVNSTGNGKWDKFSFEWNAGATNGSGAFGVWELNAWNFGF